MRDSDVEKKYEDARKVVQEWVDKQGHDRCWYYPELFRELVRIFEITPIKRPSLPPLDEFQKGCQRYQEEEYRLK